MPFYPAIVSGERNKPKTILYDDAGKEALDFALKSWRHTSSVRLHALFAYSLTVSSELNYILPLFLHHLNNEPFLRHQAQEVPQNSLRNAHESEK